MHGRLGLLRALRCLTLGRNAEEGSVEETVKVGVVGQDIGIHGQIISLLEQPLALRRHEEIHEQPRAIAQTLDAASNVAAMARMLRLASAPRLVVPGHDPQVFARFPVPGGRVARID